MSSNVALKRAPKTTKLRSASMSMYSPWLSAPKRTSTVAMFDHRLFRDGGGWSKSMWLTPSAFANS
jgi:hypothetical protein